MERPHARQLPTTFEVGPERSIIVTPQENRRFTVAIENGTEGWSLKRSGLGARKAAWLVLRAAKGMNKVALSRPIVAGRIVVVLFEEENKGTGAEWIALRALHGARPIILKAPALFRHKLIHIEATEREGIFRMRLVDPFTENMSEPIEVSRSVVDRAVRVFDSHHEQEERESLGRG